MRNSTRCFKPLLFFLFSCISLFGASEYPNHIKSHAIISGNNVLSVRGQVTGLDGEPLIAVNVVIKGTYVGTSTDENGNFTLDNVPDDAVLVFSYVSYVTKEIVVAGQSTINVVLQSDAELLDEVVVVGYGTVKKSDITGSVSSIKVDEAREGVVSSVDQLILGKSTGVNVVQGSGEPGAGFSINVRGSSSINAGNDPLYVIDGIPIDNGRPIGDNGLGVGNTRTPRNPMASLNPGDIASIEILKDASATAIYGSRGANGVILITTKSGSSGKPQINYNAYAGIQNWSNKMDLLNAQDYKRILNEIIDAGGGAESFRVADNIANTDWQDAISNKNALVNNHQFSISSGTDKLKYYISLNLLNQDGIITNSGYQRYGGRVNLETALSDKIDIGVKLVTNFGKDNFVPNGGASIEDAGAMQAAYTYDPTIAVRDNNGNYLRNELVSMDNPVALVEGIDSRSTTNRSFVSTFFKYKINEHLFFNSNFGRDYTTEIRKSFAYDITRVGAQNNGIGTIQNSDLGHILVDGSLNYSRSFNQHAINAFAGVNFEHSVSTYQSTRSSNFPSLATGYNNLGFGSRDNFLIGNNKTANRLASVMGRVNYTLNNKYLVTVTTRLDGSSRFGKDNKYGFFPSGALGWKISEEDFLKESDVVESLKLRASWGQSGNQDIGNYPSLSSFGQGQFAALDNIAVTTTTPTRSPNPNLKWETTTQMNIGLDFGLWEGRLEGTFDVFQKVTRDMLINLPIATSTGFSTRLSNIGQIDNKGLEISLNSRNVTSKTFQWTTQASLSTIRNKVVDLGPIEEIILGGAPTWGGGVGVIRPGEPMNSFIGWAVEGIWQTTDDYSGTTENVRPGDIKFVDQNGDGAINDADRIILGNSFPKLQYSLGNTFSFGGLDLTVFLEGVEGVNMLNTKMVESFYPINYRRNKLAEPYLNRWTPTNPTNDYPSFVNPTNQGVRSVNSFTVEDASYLKIRSVRLSYKVPRFHQKVKDLQVYVTGENLYTFTKYSGIDPALNTNGNANYRIDLNPYPTARTILFGINLNL